MKSTDVIGIAGSFASGKDTIAHHLVDSFGYTHISTGDLVREVAARERGSVERPVLHEVGDIYRHQHGAGYFVQQALEKSRPLVVTGIRSLGEAKEIKKAGGTLLYIDAPVELRYERMRARLRDDEATISLEEFKAREASEMHSGTSEADFNLSEIKKMADIVVDNTETAEKFAATVDSELGLA